MVARMPPPGFVPSAVRELQAGSGSGRYRERGLGRSPDALAWRNPPARTPSAQKRKASAPATFSPCDDAAGEQDAAGAPDIAGSQWAVRGSNGCSRSSRGRTAAGRPRCCTLPLLDPSFSRSFVSGRLPDAAVSRYSSSFVGGYPSLMH